MKAMDFDRRVDAGEDITAHLDLSSARRPGQEQRRTAGFRSDVIAQHDDVRAGAQFLKSPVLEGARQVPGSGKLHWCRGQRHTAHRPTEQPRAAVHVDPR